MRRSRRWRWHSGLPLLQPTRLKDPDVAATLREWQPDLGVVAAYGKIIPEDILALPALGMINVHASLLPKYRGAAPDASRGHRRRARDRRHDHAGREDARRRRHARARSRGRSAPTRPATSSSATSPSSAPRCCSRCVEQIAAGTAQEELQDFMLRHLRAAADQGRGADRLDAAGVLHSQPRARPVSLAARVHVPRRRAAHHAARHGSSRTRPTPRPGTIVDVSGDAITVATGHGGRIAIEQVQPEGRRPMRRANSSAGHRVSSRAPGSRS